MTSIPVVISRICVMVGRISALSVSRSRLRGVRVVWGDIYESNRTSVKSEYSYDQYHW